MSRYASKVPVLLLGASILWTGSCQQAAQKTGPSRADVPDGTAPDGGDVLLDVPGLSDLAWDPGTEPPVDVREDVEVVVDWLGARCQKKEDCPDGWYCVEGPDDRVCTHKCDPTCPTSYDCEPLGQGADPVFVCMPAAANLCTDCSEDTDCGRLSACVLTPTEQNPQAATCLRKCGEEEEVLCRSERQCDEAPLRDGGAEVEVCLPEPGTGCCASATENLVELCSRSNDFGICLGQRFCRGKKGWASCDATVPAEERCDTIDNDCDGDTDEDLALCRCGDGECSALGGEDLKTCPLDCAVCPDQICSPGEGPTLCPADCCGTCGDGRCIGYACEEDPRTCPEDCSSVCGDGGCDPGESPVLCPDDCDRFECGDGICDPLDGGPEDCPEDCAEFCGNCECDPVKENSFTCPNDCSVCGDHVCSKCNNAGEDLETCPEDCCVPNPLDPTDESCDGVVFNF